MKQVTFSSALAPYIEGLIRQKRADGFSYATGEYHLMKFDEYCAAHYPNAETIDRDLATAWGEIRPAEGNSYRNRRMGELRQLCLYMAALGLEVYIPRLIGREAKPVLYIPSGEEITAFFLELDSWRCRNSRCRRMLDEYKMMFRLYYCCGLRLSEVRLLKREHIDFENGVLTILRSKGEKDRLVYLPTDGMEAMTEYNSKMKKQFHNTPWMFPGQDPMKPLTGEAIEQRFKVLWRRLPFASNTEKEPTPHCLRHAFIVERMNAWMAQGLDLLAMLPYLSSYLGHKSPSETFYYYHLADRAFAVVREKDTVSQSVIPEVKCYEKS